METYCNVPPIINKGASWYKTIGPDKNHGTKAFALTGNVMNTGLIEVPMGTTLREIVEEIGGFFHYGEVGCAPHYNTYLGVHFIF